MKERVLIILATLLTRLPLAFIFFGSVDVRCFIAMMSCLLQGSLLQFPLWNYFPVIPHYLWIPAACISAGFGQVAFCLKLVPILFDTGIALLLYEYAVLRCQQQAFYMALFYALCPVPIIIISLHGQWESLFLYALLLAFFIRDFVVKSKKSYFLFGLFFGFSFLLKPASLIFLPFFFTPHEHFFKKIEHLRTYVIFLGALFGVLLVGGFSLIKYYRWSPAALIAQYSHYCIILLAMILLVVTACTLSIFIRSWHSFSASLKEYLLRQVSAIAGMSALVAFCFTCFYGYGFNLFFLCETILRYCNQGVQLMGLPFAPVIKDSFFALILRNRFILMAFVSYCAWGYYHQKRTAVASITLIFSLIFSLTGICPQYLMWLVPFMLLMNDRWWALAYSYLVTFFYFFYYVSPWGNPAMPYQNMLSCAALKNYSWATPPVFFLDQDYGVLVYWLGSLILPLFCLLYTLFQLYKEHGDTLSAYVQHQVHARVSWFFILLPFVLTSSAQLIAFFMTQERRQACCSLIAEPFSEYWITWIASRPAAIYQEQYAFFSLPTFLLILLLLLVGLMYFLQKGDADDHHN